MAPEVGAIGTGASEPEGVGGGTPPAVAATPGGHTEVEPVGTGSEEPEGSNAGLTPPVVAETPGGKHEFLAVTGATTSGAEGVGATLFPSIPAVPGLETQLPPPPNSSVKIAPEGANVGTLPTLASTPSPLSYASAGTR